MAKKRKPSGKAYVYFSDNQQDYKFGITCCRVRRGREYKTENPRHEILDFFTTETYEDAKKIEQELKNKTRRLRISPRSMEWIKRCEESKEIWGKISDKYATEVINRAEWENTKRVCQDLDAERKQKINEISVLEGKLTDASQDNQRLHHEIHKLQSELDGLKNNLIESREFSDAQRKKIHQLKRTCTEIRREKIKIKEVQVEKVVEKEVPIHVGTFVVQDESLKQIERLNKQLSEIEYSHNRTIEAIKSTHLDAERNAEKSIGSMEERIEYLKEDREKHLAKLLNQLRDAKKALDKETSLKERAWAFLNDYKRELKEERTNQEDWSLVFKYLGGFLWVATLIALVTLICISSSRDFLQKKLPSSDLKSQPSVELKKKSNPEQWGLAWKWLRDTPSNTL